MDDGVRLRRTPTRSADELLVVRDDDSDPVAERSETCREGSKIVFAGDPDGCLGKANAIAAEMCAAKNDRLVWTNDDFHHPPDWLSQLHADYERHRPVTELPFFVDRDPLAKLLEPTYAFGGTLGTYTGDLAWGGAVLFERTNLDEKAFLRELRSTMSDDGLLSEHLDVTPLRRTRTVPISGTIHETAERHVRYTQIVRWHDPVGLAGTGGVATLSAIAALCYPLPAIALLTLLHLGVYEAFGVRRWTAVLAYPAAIVQVPLFAFALARRTFVWSGRRYRWCAKFDVEIVSDSIRKFGLLKPSRSDRFQKPC